MTGGSFDLPIEVTGTVAALPANAGGRMSATVGGKPWTAANVALNRNSGNFSLSGDNSSQLVGIILTGVTTAGTYSVSVTPARLITVSGPSTSPTGLNCCWGGQIVVTGGTANLVDVGTVTITTYSSTRVVGTFSAVLGALSNTPASGQLVIANGSFDVGIP